MITSNANIELKKHLCADALIACVNEQFQKIPDPRKSTRAMPISEILMVGLAIFKLKFPSLLQYDNHRDTLDHNLKNLFHVKQFPSDSYVRERLDEVDPNLLRKPFKKIFARLQRGKYLDSFEFLDGHYLLALDGTGHFSSSNICCEQCCKKHHQNGSITYYHQMLGACIVHPNQSNVIPLCPEVILNEDGTVKNDCERNATKRFIEKFKKEHPHLKVIVIGDGITSNAPYIRLLEKHKIKYILGAKPGDHVSLFKSLEESEDSKYHEVRDEHGFLHQFRYLNNTPLNKSNQDVLVNVLEYRETSPDGKETNFSWVTNIPINHSNAKIIMEGGRARWKIENNTFNTLKNLGHNFEHNYGHGKKYLSTVFCLLMMLTFLIDQTESIACHLFQAVRKKGGSLKWLWETIRVLFQFVSFQSWEELYRQIAAKLKLDTS